MARKSENMHDKVAEAKFKFLNMRHESQLEYVSTATLSSVEIAALDSCKMFMKPDVKKAYNDARLARQNVEKQPM